MKQYILDNNTKQFNKDDIHHILNVMRFKNNDKVIVCFNNECFMTYLKIDGKSVSYEIIEKVPKKNYTSITLLQGNIKGNKIDTTVKYATIFGVTSIIISDFKRSISVSKNIEHKLIRYNKIAKEASELSKRPYIPNIIINSKIDTINYNEYDLIILADEDENKQKIDDVFNTNKTYNNILIIIGPEGGIDPDERIFFKKKNAKIVTLGKYIYPSEIASLKLLSLIDNSFDK